MEVETISVGSELLCGRIRDLNAPFIAFKLTELGFGIVRQTIVGDNSRDLKHLLLNATEKADFIIITGGLGPTVNDLTRETVSDFCNLKLVNDKNSVNHIENLTKKAHAHEYINSSKQAMIPEGGIVIHNSTGTAQGFVVNANSRCKILCLPGVPAEMKLMFEEWVIPFIQREAGRRNKSFSRVINTFGISESLVDEKLKTIIKPDQYLSYITLVNHGVVSIYITIRDMEVNKSYSILNETDERICKEFGVSVFSKGKLRLEDIILKLLKLNNLKLAIAESCTGGLVSNLLTNVPGSSEFFSGGIVSYSANVKKETLNVSEKLIDEHGVISTEAAKAMAYGVRDKLKADIGLAVTGNAGPTCIEEGADQGKPVGLVYVAITINGNSECKKYCFFGSRTGIKRRAANTALNLLRLCLSEKQTVSC